MIAPGHREIVTVMRAWARVLRDSYVHRIGPDKGKLPAPIAREIECINEGINIIKRAAVQNRSTRVKRK